VVRRATDLHKSESRTRIAGESNRTWIPAWTESGHPRRHYVHQVLERTHGLVRGLIVELLDDLRESIWRRIPRQFRRIRRQKRSLGGRPRYLATPLRSSRPVPAVHDLRTARLSGECPQEHESHIAWIASACLRRSGPVGTVVGPAVPKLLSVAPGGVALLGKFAKPIFLSVASCDRHGMAERHHQSGRDRPH